MLSCLSAAYAASRASCIFFGRIVSPQVMLYACMILIGIGSGTLFAFSNESELMVWVSLIVMGAGLGPTMPALLSFMEERVNVNNRLSGWLMFSSNTSVIVNSLLVGQLVESSPHVFVYVNIISLTACCCIFVALYVNDRQR